MYWRTLRDYLALCMRLCERPRKHSWSTEAWEGGEGPVGPSNGAPSSAPPLVPGLRR